MPMALTSTRTLAPLRLLSNTLIGLSNIAATLNEKVFNRLPQTNGKVNQRHGGGYVRTLLPILNGLGSHTTGYC